MTFGYSPGNDYEEGPSRRGRLLIEDAYEHIPEVGIPPSPPNIRPESTGYEADDVYYSRLADDPDYTEQSPGHYDVIKKPTEDDYYDYPNVL